MDGPFEVFFPFFSVDPFKVFISGGEVYRRKENLSRTNGRRVRKPWLDTSVWVFCLTFIVSSKLKWEKVKRKGEDIGQSSTTFVSSNYCHHSPPLFPLFTSEKNRIVTVNLG